MKMHPPDMDFLYGLNKRRELIMSIEHSAPIVPCTTLGVLTAHHRVRVISFRVVPHHFSSNLGENGKENTTLHD